MKLTAILMLLALLAACGGGDPEDHDVQLPAQCGSTTKDLCK